MVRVSIETSKARRKVRDQKCIACQGQGITVQRDGTSDPCGWCDGVGKVQRTYTKALAHLFLVDRP